MKNIRFELLVLSLLAISMTSCNTESADVGEDSDVGRQVQEDSQTKTSSSPSSAAVAKVDAETVLGRRFLSAIQENDMEKYHSCWLRIQDVEAFVENPPPEMPVPTVEQIEQMRAYYKKRDEFIVFAFPIIRRALLNKCGDLADLTISSVTPTNVSDDKGQKMASSIELVIAGAEKLKLEYSVDDGAFLNKRWYFTDRPSSLIAVTFPDGKFQRVSIGEYVTKEEFQKIQSLGLQ